MSCQVYFEDRFSLNIKCDNVSLLKRRISQQYGIPCEDLYITINGKIAGDDFGLKSEENVVRVCTKLVGGKGGFGSMLRAIGAQIEKTTNREACRDLSGRRLRDINEEKRLRKWLEGQEDREREAAERKQKKIERLLAEPKIEVNLASYEKERQQLPERVSAAVDAGWNAAGTSNGVKRKAEDDKPKTKKKKLWIDADLSDCSSLSDDEEDEVVKASPSHTQVSTDSGHESDQLSEVSK
ncbi:replication stress response regulator SDE2 [Pectinophora gossypiella]|uniref:replication stress response regulator SDE2 n=1 Tax=Pectinophora gossypiella TaxID=13191 RepID=UPI00214E1997|nr:replication stress response regulator SDE2 [Pectinophora gossypiella]